VKTKSHSTGYTLSAAAVIVGVYLLSFAFLIADELAGWGIFKGLPEPAREGLRTFYAPIIFLIRAMMGAPPP
jgi:di/tricarboxylate transporter